jgi:1-acyl-sn-glycerol-3-phosphate acyltransferase
MGRGVSQFLSVFMFRLRVGVQHHIPRTGGVLMITNHQSFLDPWLIGIGLRRQLHYMARDSLFRGGFLHYLMELWNAFPVKRGSADLTAIRTAVERLDKGFIVNIFPEGTRSEDGTIGPIAPGMSIILNRCKQDVPIVPVVIDGAFAAWPRNRKFPKGHPIKLIHGKAIPAAEWRKLSPEELSQRIRGEMVKLQEQIGSPYAAASRERLEREAAAPAQKTRRQRG